MKIYTVTRLLYGEPWYWEFKDQVKAWEFYECGMRSGHGQWSISTRYECVCARISAQELSSKAETKPSNQTQDE